MNKFKIFFIGFKKGQKEFSDGLTIIVNSVALIFVYIFGVGLTAIIAKVFGKRFLNLKINKKARTYWSDLNLDKEPTKNYYRQF